MADKPDIELRNLSTKPKLTKKQQKEEKKLKKELESKRATEERAEKLRNELEAKEKAKKEAIEKKRLEAERLVKVDLERRRQEAEERQKRENEELKRRMEEILLADPVPKIVSPMKIVFDQLRDNLLHDLNQKDVRDSFSKNKLHQLSKLVSQSSEYELKRALLHEGYSFTTRASPARILFDLGHGAGSTALSEMNGERSFFCGLASWLFGDSQDMRYRVQFDQKGNSMANSITGLECKMIGDGKPQTLEQFCVNVKKFLIVNRIAWRDLDLSGILAEIEKEPRRTEHVKEALRAFRSRATLRTESSEMKVLMRSFQHEIGDEKRICEKLFDHMILQMVTTATTAKWKPLIRDSTKSSFDHLSDAKLILSKFPPSIVKCPCDICSGKEFVLGKFDAAIENYRSKYDINDLKAWQDIFDQDHDFKQLRDAFDRKASNIADGSDQDRNLAIPHDLFTAWTY